MKLPREMNDLDRLAALLLAALAKPEPSEEPETKKKTEERKKR